MSIKLNEMQKEAVLCTEGPLLILAGAGSGKTRVITERAAYLVGEKNVSPWNILAITFTNKAAAEMKERIERAVGQGAEAIWVSTFHSMCVRILRRYGDRLGYGSSFSIYDTDDSRALMRRLIKEKNLNPKEVKERTVLNAISRAKDELVNPAEYKRRADAAGNPGMLTNARLYEAYQNELKKSNAMDFDDLINLTVELFASDPEVKEYYQDRFRYIMVDEYQDTNTAQFRLVEFLAGKYKNLCVVGDDDQSIYKFRGANIRNILDFELSYPDARVIRLEENYRSTPDILNVANAVIANNRSRKGKTLYTGNPAGDKVKFNWYQNAAQEAAEVASDIRQGHGYGKSLSDYAVLYRTNAQSRLFEERLVSANIPYRLVGGVNFYSRKEIKDFLAYLKAVENPSDDMALTRIINVPKRGIGATTVDNVSMFASAFGISFYEALQRADEISGIKAAAAKKLKDFVGLIEEFGKASIGGSVYDVLEKISADTGYVEELKAERTDEAAARLENIDELFSKAKDYDDGDVPEGREKGLSDFLQEVALVADVDALDDESEYVTLMTLHGAKGLEFENVYLVGMEEGMFPGYMSINSDDESEIEEERRLCYVGMTRAKKSLTLSGARERMVHGNTNYNPPSRFVDEIPPEMLDRENNSVMGISRMANGGRSYRKETYPGSSRGAAPVSSHSIPSRPKAPSIKKPSSYGGYTAKAPAKSDSGDLGYGVGDRVSHFKFGEGTVLGIKDGGRDYEVTVDFDSAGQKKMFAGFAKLKKV